MTKLHEAVRWHRLEEIRELLGGGCYADIMEDERLGTSLHYAAALGYADVTELLIGHGANINAKDESGITPIQLAEAASRYISSITPPNPFSDYPATIAVFRKHRTWVERCCETTPATGIARD